VLVLSRRIGESIVIGDDITITVLEARGDNIRLGVTAPRDIIVNRSEVAAAIAAGTPGGVSETAETAST
jgi:carbon storage regulator